MPEPISPAAATLYAATATVPAITAWGISTGLRPDVLVAGFAGSLVAITLLNAVPGSIDSWHELLRTTARRMCVAIASSLTAGYLSPLVLLLHQLPDAMLVGGAFAVGAGAQKVLSFVIGRLAGQPQMPAGEGAQ